jgi:hypothetical protein
MIKRLFFTVLLAGATVFALGASVWQIDAQEPHCVDYKCGNANPDIDCTKIDGGPHCDLCSVFDNLCGLKP